MAWLGTEAAAADDSTWLTYMGRTLVLRQLSGGEMRWPAALVTVKKVAELREERMIHVSRLRQGPAGGYGGRTRVGAPRVGSGTMSHMGTTTIAREVSFSSCRTPGVSHLAMH